MPRYLPSKSCGCEPRGRSQSLKYGNLRTKDLRKMSVDEVEEEGCASSSASTANASPKSQRKLSKGVKKAKGQKNKREKRKDRKVLLDDMYVVNTYNHEPRSPSVTISNLVIDDGRRCFGPYMAVHTWPCLRPIRCNAEIDTKFAG